MTFDLLTYAAAHRCRVRNLHDGGPVPPVRRFAAGDRQVAYRGRDDREDVIRRAKEAGVGYIITIGTTVESSRDAVLLAEKHDSVYAAVGIHPHEAKDILLAVCSRCNVVGMDLVEVAPMYDGPGQTTAMHGARLRERIDDVETQRAYRRLQRDFVDLKDHLAENRDQPAITADGETVELLANISNLADARVALDQFLIGNDLHVSSFFIKSINPRTFS